MEVGGIDMGFWSFIQCRWCGFTGCVAPLGDECPNCGRLPEPEPKPVRQKAGEPAPA